MLLGGQEQSAQGPQHVEQGAIGAHGQAAGESVTLGPVAKRGGQGAELLFGRLKQLFAGPGVGLVDVVPGGEALDLAVAQQRGQGSLVELVQSKRVVGETAWLADDILEARERSVYKEDIILIGRVSFEELRALYQGARLFAFPSLYEGFGLPVLEAFASSTPVLLASNSSLGEVGGRAALYVNAQSVPDIAEKLERLWSDSELRAELVARGHEQLKKFSWDKCARETLDYIQS